MCETVGLKPMGVAIYLLVRVVVTYQAEVWNHLAHSCMPSLLLDRRLAQRQANQTNRHFRHTLDLPMQCTSLIDL